ncbi:dynamin-binding protein-like [Uloborus diversus]|uniref:dynamin-binding protein-like n=1 Tax=Uloborus diversus TaxID=327109 RepID=UPI00240A3EB0|nr:dynamin-binding protein-like [Uloborus diversus]
MGRKLDMEPKAGRLVKAIYDFPTDDENELPLLIGDIIQVKDQIDKQWSYGICGNRQGNFPLGFTSDVSAPSLTDNQQLFAVTNDFAAQESGDLTLKRGSLVIGHEALDSNWWKGEVDGQQGIFPLTHVWKIDKNSLPVSTPGKKMSLKAKVKMNMTAQLDEEMDLFKDDIVTIFEEVEKGCWPSFADSSSTPTHQSDNEPSQYKQSK